ncbi:radical SAM protein [Aliivibrio fischeri]|uniref:radical SAM protein n=1 Tax=Aliivibrio fischeri TaxID=668 RepID=UPI00080E034A|nr:radical SAM protein [Aliivibrio fischeri]OCH41114.1 radical SAM protein [Aliivibrio fischeri]
MIVNSNNILSLTSTSRVMSINWALMNNCNYKCKYCHSDLNSGSIKSPEYNIVVVFVKKIIKQCQQLNLTPYFEFGGGEVTLLRYFSELIELIHKNDGLISIISNGSKSLDWWKANTPYLGGVSLSYHVNDIKDNNHFIDVAKILEQSKNTRLHINVMMDPERFSDCLFFAKQLKKEIRCSIALQPLYEGFGHGGITKKYTYTLEQEKEMQTFRGRADNKNLPEPRAYLDVTYLDGSKKTLSTFDLLITDNVNFIGWDCYAGIESMVITFSGEIYRAWCMQDGPIGSIYDEIITLPTTPIRCRTKICQCGADISAKKVNTTLLKHYQNSIETKYIE